MEKLLDQDEQVVKEIRDINLEKKRRLEEGILEPAEPQESVEQIIEPTRWIERTEEKEEIRKKLRQKIDKIEQAEEKRAEDIENLKKRK